jgi:hypothetical protein
MSRRARSASKRGGVSSCVVRSSDQRIGWGESEICSCRGFFFVCLLNPGLFFVPLPSARVPAKREKKRRVRTQTISKTFNLQPQNIKSKKRKGCAPKERKETTLLRNVEARSKGDVPPHRLRHPLHLPPQRRVAHHASCVSELAGGLFE